MPPDRTQRGHGTRRARRQRYIDDHEYSTRMDRLASLLRIDRDRDGGDLDDAEASVQLRLLLHCLGLENNSCANFLNDAMIVCIHTSLRPRDGRCVYEVGISTLDTRSVTSLSNTATPNGLITTYNYRTPSYVVNGRNFIFGLSEAASIEYFSLLIKKVLLTGSPVASAQELRDVVLVGFKIHPEIRALLRMDICKREIIKNLYTIDVRQLGIGVLGHELNLRELLKRLNVPFGALDNGGNDSNFTMKALILLAIRSFNTNELLLEEELDRHRFLRVMATESHDEIDEKYMALLKHSEGSEVSRSADLAKLQAFSDTYDAIIAPQKDGLPSATSGPPGERQGYFASIFTGISNVVRNFWQEAPSLDGSNQVVEGIEEDLEVQALGKALEDGGEEPVEN